MFEVRSLINSTTSYHGWSKFSLFGGDETLLPFCFEGSEGYKSVPLSIELREQLQESGDVDFGRYSHKP